MPCITGTVPGSDTGSSNLTVRDLAAASEPLEGTTEMTATVENSGSKSGTRSYEFGFEGQTQGILEVDVAAGSTKEVTFSISPNSTGDSKSIFFGSYSETFNVVSPDGGGGSGGFTTKQLVILGVVGAGIGVALSSRENLNYR